MVWLGLMSQQELIQTLYSEADQRTKLVAYWGRANLLPCPQQFSFRFNRKGWCWVSESYKSALKIYDWENGHDYGNIYTKYFDGKEYLIHGWLWDNKFTQNARYALKFKEE